jgi:hydroxyacylglutathione hydrolase
MYFLFASTKNRQAHEALHEDVAINELTHAQVLDAQRRGAWVIDTRDAADFAAGHLRRSINVGLGGRFAEYAGEVVPAGAPIVLVTDPGHEHEAQIRLARIGFDNVLGALNDPLQSFLDHPDSIDRASRLSAAELANCLGDEATVVQLVDVRGPGEVASGMIDGAIHLQLPQLIARLGELDPTLPTVVYCAGGYRSSIAASALRAHDFTDVSDLLGGMGAWASRREASATP